MVDGIRSEQVDALTSVCPGGIIGIRRQTPAHPQQHHTSAVAALLTRTQPDGEHLGLSARQQAQQPGVGQLRGNRRRLQGSLGLPHRRPGTHQLHRPSILGMGQSLGYLVLFGGFAGTRG